MNQLLTGTGDQALNTYQSLLEPISNESFNQSVTQPALQNYSQDILPAIEQRFTDANAGTSSALNQALAKSSQDLSSLISKERMGYEQNRSNQQLNALSQLLNLLSSKQNEPIVQGPQPGLLRDIIGSGSGLLSSFL